MRVLAIDPGSAKCGLAVVDASAGLLHKEIVATPELASRAAALSAGFSVSHLLIGDGTRRREQEAALRAALPDIPLVCVPEAFTTERARRRWRIENPPRGLARLIPSGLRLPKGPVDDIVAQILAEDWLARR